jgi:beta-1,2-mannobiose phosphorylase / 1,2-beta-oligomannan phosphorylase
MSESHAFSSALSSECFPFTIERLGVVMQADPQDSRESWGVLNPACARSRQGDLLLFPRVVGDANRSRIGVARVLFSDEGDPCSVERLGYALEPTEPYEVNRLTAGCEDPRISFIPELGVYLMAYVAYGPLGSRIAFAKSSDLISWTRLGLAKFDPASGVEFDFYINKDALLFPELIRDPYGRLCIGLIHRPDYDLSRDPPPYRVLPFGITDSRPGMWLSYCPVDRLDSDLKTLAPFSCHHLLAAPEEPWEALKIGGGTAPLKTEHGWLTLFHGVSGTIFPGIRPQTEVHYAAGAMVLDLEDPRRVLYRSRNPILEPEFREETEGFIPNVVFPTALDQRGGGRVDVYYGMADSRIGVGTLHIPDALHLQIDTNGDGEAVA